MTIRNEAPQEKATKNEAPQGMELTFNANFTMKKGRRPTAHRPMNQRRTAPAAIPRVARLLALAHYLDAQVRSGAVKDYAELARILGVTKARVSQILNLVLLAPDIQEKTIFLSTAEEGCAPMTERHVRLAAVEPNWETQRAIMHNL